MPPYRSRSKYQRGRVFKFCLCGKVAVLGDVDDSTIGMSNSKREEALSALEVLGYSRKQTTKVIDKIIGDNSEISVEGIIKDALNKL